MNIGDILKQLANQANVTVHEIKDEPDADPVTLPIPTKAKCNHCKSEFCLENRLSRTNWIFCPDCKSVVEDIIIL